MGVRGLTTYISKNAEQYLAPFELHDCNLVIDGDNLASQLFNKVFHSAFGGNYDGYFKAVVAFFTMLRTCKVTAFVLMDGGYEERKMRTIKSRLQTRIAAVKYVLPLTRRPVIPLFMREVFIDAARASKVPVMRCMFEADDEIAILARKLDCPVLSYDSDFFIHNVMYIPFITLTHKVYRKSVEDEKNYEIEILGKPKGKGKQKKSGKKVVVTSKTSDTTEAAASVIPKEEYCYIDCCLYTIENLVGKRALNKEMLPLFATLIGNDYIERKLFRKFYSHVKIKKGRKKNSPQQKRIQSIFLWLKNETLKSALGKILGAMKLSERQRLLAQIQTAMNGYNNEICVSYEYFGFIEENVDVSPLEFDLESLLNIEEESESEELEVNEDEGSDEEEEAEQNVSGSEDDVNSEEETVEMEEQEPEDPQLEANEEKTVNTFESRIPEWLKQKFMNAELPRFVMDLLAGRRYVNYPQVEDLTLNDANEISYPILLRIYAIVHHPNKPTLWYMTRVQRYARFHYKKFEATEIPDVQFDFKKQKNLQEFLHVFEKFSNRSKIFEEVNRMPESVRLYLLAIIYWMSKSKLVTSIHLQAAVLGILANFLIERKFSITRDETKYQKNYEKLLEQLKPQFKQQSSIPESKSLTEITKAITKHEAILAMEKMVTYFSVNDKFQRKHADFKRSIVHAFSELQSVCYNFYTLNAFSNYPFDQIKMAQVFDGLFLYNIYVSLKSRTDPTAFIKDHLFKYAPNFLQYYEQVFNWCKNLLPNLTLIDSQRLKMKPVKIHTSKEIAVKAANKNFLQKCVENDCVATGNGSGNQDDDDEDFVDLNNKFSQLLKMNEL